MDRITAGACRLITDSIYRRITGFPKKKNTEQVINISLYNAYNRNNPAYLAVDIIQDKDKNGKKDQLIIRKRGKSIYGIIPSISYSFKF